jgi:hypothetical protein
VIRTAVDIENPVASVALDFVLAILAASAKGLCAAMLRCRGDLREGNKWARFGNRAVGVILSMGEGAMGKLVGDGEQARSVSVPQIDTIVVDELADDRVVCRTFLDK